MGLIIRWSKKWLPLGIIVMLSLSMLVECHQSIDDAFRKDDVEEGVVPEWLDGPEDRAEDLVAKMTLDEKISLLHGMGQHWGTNGYVGATCAIPRLGIPALKLEDGPQGVADGVPYATAWPSALTVVASWDRQLVKEFAAAMAKEQKIKGTNVMLGPMVNIARVPQGGRNFESFGEDPYLSADMAKVYVKGTQGEGVIACVKHFANNNQEYDRQTVSATVPSRAQWELYYPAFQAAIHAGVGSVMCGYNRVNDTYACENSQILNNDLKGKMGFEGWIMSDWGATHSTKEAALAGLDQEMPGGDYFEDALKAAVDDGSVPMARIDDMVKRMLWAMFSVKLFDETHQPSGTLDDPATSTAHNALAQKLAAAGTVLLKNEEGLLPLPRSLKRIAVVGDDAQLSPQVTGGGSGAVIPPYVITPLQAISEKAARIGASVTYTPTNPPGTAGKAAAHADVAIVFVSTSATEGADRESLSLGSDQDLLVKSTLASQPRTIVVVHAPGAVLMPWAINTSTILTGFMPGQADGAAIVDVLFGDVVPGGKLPLTFPNSEDETWLQGPDQYPGINKETYYSEELLVGYRWYDAKGIAPLFPFGHGLSYTTFFYSHLKVRSEVDADLVIITVDITNMGRYAAYEVVQLYIGFPPSAGEPPKQLKGFQRLYLEEKQRKGSSFSLCRRDFSIWSVEKTDWELVPGRFQIFVGSSSQDIRLRDEFDLESFTATI